MIGTQELTAAFEAIGLTLRVMPTGLDFRVTPGEPGIDVLTFMHGDQPHVELRVNYTRVVDLQVVEVDAEDRYLVLAADDWGDTLDAPPRVFRIGVGSDGRAYSDAITEFSADD
ncbi:MAG: hypothetical protein AAGF84_10565 [Planctomycetota bacterium]